jgi:hypothetical protein
MRLTRGFGRIHWRTACRVGNAMGQAVAEYVLSHAMQLRHGDVATTGDDAVDESRSTGAWVAGPNHGNQASRPSLCCRRWDRGPAGRYMAYAKPPAQSDLGRNGQ